MYIVCWAQFSFYTKILKEKNNYFDIITHIYHVKMQHTTMSELLLDAILFICFKCSEVFNTFFPKEGCFPLYHLFCLHVSCFKESKDVITVITDSL